MITPALLVSAKPILARPKACSCKARLFGSIYLLWPSRVPLAPFSVFQVIDKIDTRYKRGSVCENCDFLLRRVLWHGSKSASP